MMVSYSMGVNRPNPSWRSNDQNLWMVFGGVT